MSLPPLKSPLPGAAPPDRRAALELRRAQLRAAPPKAVRASRADEFVTVTPVSTESGESQASPKRADPNTVTVGGRPANLRKPVRSSQKT